MGASDIKAGRAYVELFLKNSLAKGLKQVSTQFKTMGGEVMKIGMLATTVGTVITSAFIAPIKAAGDLQETMSKFGAVFGDQAPAAEAWMNDFTAAVGRSKKEVADSLSAFQGFFSGLGVAGGEAAGLSKEMTGLAVDFASFHNMQDPEAMQRFISALSGSGEVLSMYGINIMEAALNQKLLAMGFPTIAKGATETQKVMARMDIIKESMGRQGAVGDAIRTAGSFSNQMKALKGSLMDTAATIGKALLPVVTPLVTKAAELVKVFANWAAGNQEIIATAFKVAAGIAAAGVVITGLGAALYGVGIVAGTAATAIGGIATVLGLVLTPVGLITAGLIGGAIAWTQWTESGKAAVSSLGELFGGMLGTFKDTWGGIVNAVKAGDLALAGKIALAGLTLAWYQGTADILKTWLDVKLNVLSAWQEMHTALTKTYLDWMVGFKSAWVNVVAFMESQFTKIKSFFADAKSLHMLMLEVAEHRAAKNAGKITEEEFQTRKRASQEKHLGAIGQSDAERQETLANIEGGRASDIAGLNSGAQTEKDRIDRENMDAQNRLQEEYGNAMEARREAIRRAQADLDQGRDDAFWLDVARGIEEDNKKKGAAEVDAANKGGVEAMKNPGKAGGSFGSTSAAALMIAGMRGRDKPEVVIAKKQLELEKDKLAVDKKILEVLKKKAPHQIEVWDLQTAGR